VRHPAHPRFNPHFRQCCTHPHQDECPEQQAKARNCDKQGHQISRID
jgi:hypothetical protein